MKTNGLFSASATVFPGANYMPNNRIVVNREYPFKTYTFGKGIEFLKCDFKNFSTQRIMLPSNIANKYVFIFNLNEKLQISGAGQEKIYMPKLHNLLLYTTKETFIEFNFQKNNSYKACIFIIEANTFNNNMKDFVGENSKLYFEKDELVYKALPNLKISDYVYKLWECKKGFPENLISLGYINIIIGLLLNQYIESKNGIEKSRSCLRPWEITELQKITEQIRQYPEQNYSIKSLARQSGVSIPKLQEGFKEMHGHTISNYIREVRLIKAEDLLKNSDLNISEIVYSVGLCSRSYFSRIFKKKYKCTPTDYQRQQFSLAVTA